LNINLYTTDSLNDTIYYGQVANMVRLYEKYCSFIDDDGYDYITGTEQVFHELCYFRENCDLKKITLNFLLE